MGRGQHGRIHRGAGPSWAGPGGGRRLLWRVCQVWRPGSNEGWGSGLPWEGTTGGTQLGAELRAYGNPEPYAGVSKAQDSRRPS